MKSALLFTAALLAASPALAQEADFHLAYHVERTPAASLDLQGCAAVARSAAEAAGYRAALSDYPGQLAVISGGKTNVGTFVVQCIAVENVTVSVIQGIDYRQTKGQMGEFADRLHRQMMAARK